MLLRGSEGNELELAIVGYQFPAEERDPWDSNWLLVSLRVLAPQGSWSVTDPCLTTWEAARLVSWLAHAGGREPSPASMAFDEPNLTVVARSVAGMPYRVVIRAGFALELRPPWARSLVAGSDDLTVDLEVGRDDLARAAASLLDDLARFPQRGDDPTL
ncbi:MAG: WapI family immunity protein [Acidimicrobiales bacterium]